MNCYPLFSARFFLILLYPTWLMLAGCSSQKLSLAECNRKEETHCVNSFFTPGDNSDLIKARDKSAFPQYYLELYDESARKAACPVPDDKSCLDRMDRLAHYFFPKGHRPSETEIGVALEGGGTKSASFALGTLAGLQEAGLLRQQVTAISSISGGSYAASYLYNRYFDALSEPNKAGDLSQWFNSCIPDSLVQTGHRKYFDLLQRQVKNHQCGELAGESIKFKAQYKYLGQVWTQHDLLLSSFDESAINSTMGSFWIHARLVDLLGETIISTPAQFVGRTLFRWPINSSPSKHAYKLGLERAYGYSPDAWDKDKHNLNGIDLCTRRSNRTLADFNKLVVNSGKPLPQWLIGTTAPGFVAFDSWLKASPRDPVRQQFEISWTGSGSGIYGYTTEPLSSPTDLYDIFCPVESMPIVDAVVESSAFFDDEELLISQQPYRFIFGVVQQFLDLTWFGEIPNYNVGNTSRAVANVLIYPFNLYASREESKNPNIHLQDGGNSDNSGLMPLLRRGYHTIVYSHSTQDDQAQWSGLCHVKNQLELDGNYRMESEDFERYMTKQYLSNPFMTISGKRFASYLDGICSVQLDESDLAAFDENTDNSSESRKKAVANLFCNRLMRSPESVNKDSAEVCPEYEKFKSHITHSDGVDFAKNLSYYAWPSGQTMTFQVYSTNGASSKGNALLSTIIAVVPAVSWNDVANQVAPVADGDKLRNWDQWCATDLAYRQNQTIKYCFGPRDELLKANAMPEQNTGLPCTALAHLLENSCHKDFGTKHPIFPQDNFIKETINVGYVTYAAYFDLARHKLRETLCNDKLNVNKSLKKELMGVCKQH